MSRWGDLFAALSGTHDISDTSRHIGDASAEVSRCVRSVNAPEGQKRGVGEPADDPAKCNLRDSWGDSEEERAAVVEYEAGVPCAWAEGFARLNPDRPPADVPRQRWLTFIDDCGRFLDSGFAAKAAALGWGAYDLFGCDRDRPLARIDQCGLLWLLNGNRLLALTAESATVEPRPGARQTYCRKPTAPGRVLAWELAL